MPPQHLIPVGPDVANVALLANPLAALIEAAQSFLVERVRTVWICGDTVEAAMLDWIIEDAGLQVLIVGRQAMPHSEFPVHDLNEYVRKVKDGLLPSPDLLIDFTGSFEAAAVLAPAVTQAKAWWGVQRPTRLRPDMSFHRLPLVASSRRAVRDALGVLKLLQALDGRTDRFFLTSTIDLYLKTHPRVLFEHQGQLDPSDQEGTTFNQRYLRGKRGCEKVIRASGLAWTVIRPCVVTGRRDNQSCAPARSGISVGEPSRSLFYPCRVRDGAPILLRQDDEAAFNLIWVADLAKAILALLQTRASIGEAYNVAGDEVWTSERLILMMLRAAGRPPDIMRVSPTLLAPAGLPDYQPPYGLGPVWSIVENQKLRSLGWRPTAPETWMADLIEAAPSHFVRGWYEPTTCVGSARTCCRSTTSPRLPHRTYDLLQEARSGPRPPSDGCDRHSATKPSKPPGICTNSAASD
jgi:nucleoside-diphosphate-sugar epimerase